MAEKLLPSVAARQTYKMPDYGYVHREMQKSGVRLNLLWLEYCEQCRLVGELPYKSTQFNKYYADYVHKTKATMHLNNVSRLVFEVHGGLGFVNVVCVVLVELGGFVRQFADQPALFTVFQP